MAIDFLKIRLGAYKSERAKNLNRQCCSEQRPACGAICTHLQIADCVGSRLTVLDWPNAWLVREATVGHQALQMVSMRTPPPRHH